MSGNPNPTELTPERIAEFERRADAGETPRHSGWAEGQRYSATHRRWTLGHGRELASVFENTDDDSDIVNGYGIIWAREVYTFSSLAAAQLAAEWLLMEAVEPLVPGLPELDRLRLDHAALASEIDAVEKALGIPDGPAGWRHPHEVAAELRARVMELEAAAMELADAAKNNVWSLATERAIDRICRAVAKERGDER
jgi:hypothetical protein